MHGFTGGREQTKIAQLPWGLPLEVSMRDSIGYSIVTGGVFDPCVTESLHRLIDRGDVVVDIGANVGYMTSLAAVRAGPDGKVLAFEPHPRVYELLERNAVRWREQAAVGGVELHRVALSDRSGEGTLIAGPAFEANMGLATLASEATAPTDQNPIRVMLARLDELAADERPGLLKIDVEGHEAEVLRGADRLLAIGGVRDIIFEDHGPYPSAATAVVEELGYRLISLDNGLMGLRLSSPGNRGKVSAWPGPSYLATRDIERATHRLAPRGWQVEGIGPRRRRRSH